MCCGTHDLRDSLAQALEGKLPVFAERPEFQCQCMFGRQCKRRMTGEDFRCDWCREIEGNHWRYAVEFQGHDAWLDKYGQVGYGGYIDEPVFMPARLPDFEFKRFEYKPFEYSEIEQRIARSFFKGELPPL